MYQILDYPPLDLATDIDLKERISEDLESSTVKMYNLCYLNDEEDGKNPLASPVYATNLDQMPPALIMTAETDILLKEAKCYRCQVSNSRGIMVFNE